MEFSECRQKVFQDLVSVVDREVAPSKVFLLLGGIRAGIYQYNAKGLPFFIPSGVEMMHYPAILGRFELDYNKISIDKVIKNCKRDSHYLDKKILILLFLDSILENCKKTNFEDNIFGDSQLTIKGLDFKQNRVILNHENTKHYWVDIDVFREIESRKKISMTNQLCIYELDREEIRQNQYFVSYIGTSSEELLRSCSQQFMKERKIRITDNCIRYDGNLAYHFMEKSLLGLLNEYKGCQDDDRKKKIESYVRGMMLQYKRFATVGSEGNYRNEFAHILFNMGTGYAEVAQAWKTISMMWIQMTLEITKLLAQRENVMEEILNCMIKFHKEIAKIELEQMKVLEEIM